MQINSQHLTLHQLELVEFAYEYFSTKETIHKIALRNIRLSVSQRPRQLCQIGGFDTPKRKELRNKKMNCGRKAEKRLPMTLLKAV